MIALSELTARYLQGEEMHNAYTVLPRVMIGTIGLNSMLGLGFLLALLFCIGDTDSVLNTSLRFPIIQIFYNTTGSHAATAALIPTFISVAIASTFGLLASTSRTTWAFARDRGLPFSALFAHVRSYASLQCLWTFQTNHCLIHCR